MKHRILIWIGPLAAVAALLAWRPPGGSQGASPPTAPLPAHPLVGCIEPYLSAKSPEKMHEVMRFCREATREAIPHLLRMATAGDALVASNAIRALGRLKEVRANSAVISLLQDPRRRVRQEMVVALGLSGDPQAVGAMEPLLRKRDPSLEPLLVQAFGRLGGSRSRELVAGVLRDPSAGDVSRAFAREALAAIPDG